MSGQFAEEVRANLQRAQRSLEAARQLEAGLYYDFAAGRAYYAAFYAATALLLHDGVEMSRHSGVIAAIHQRYIKTGKLDRTQGKSLNWLFELRSVGDYGGLAHVSRTDAEQAIAMAEKFLQAVFTFMNSSGDALQDDDTAAFG
jgi:uncharacterized protein (UPF0332 family)